MGGAAAVFAAMAAAVVFLEGMEGKEEDLEKITPMTFEENCIMTLDSAKWASHIAKVSSNFLHKFPTLFSISKLNLHTVVTQKEQVSSKFDQSF